MNLRVKKMLLRIFLLLCFFICLELVLSWYIERNTTSKCRPHPFLFWQIRAHNPEGTNSLGLRDYEIPRKKEAHELRILLLGDSSIYGETVSLKQSVAKLLEEMLRKAFPEKRIYVINCGVQAYSSYQGKYLLRELGPKLKPDIMISGYFHSDMVLSYQEDKNVNTNPEPIRYLQLLLFKSNLYLLLRKEIGLGKIAHQEAMARQDRMKGYVFPDKVLYHRVTVDDYRNNLKEITDISRNLGARAVFLNMPSAWPADISTPVAGLYRAALKDAAKEAGAPIVDLDAAFFQYKPMSVRADVIHPNAEGHKVMAREIYGCLVYGGILGKEEGGER